MRGIVVKTPPPSGATLDVVTLVQAKAHMRIDTTADDTYITDLIAASRDQIEAEADISILTQTLVQTEDNFPYWNSPFRLMRYPVQKINSIKYVDGAGVTQTLDPARYVMNAASIPPQVAPVYSSFWPILALQTLANVSIDFDGGWVDAAHVPPRVKQAVLLLIGHWYENREDVAVGPRVVAVEIKRAVDAILLPFKRPMVA